MDDLISRAELLKAYDAEHIGQPGRARKLIEDAPAIRIVRCKDCMYFGNADKCIVQKYLYEHPEKIWFLSLQENRFCADGKKKQS